MTPSFPARVEERRLVHKALAYLAAAWVLLQVLELVGGPLAR